MCACLDTTDYYLSGIMLQVGWQQTFEAAQSYTNYLTRLGWARLYLTSEGSKQSLSSLLWCLTLHTHRCCLPWMQEGGYSHTDSACGLPC